MLFTRDARKVFIIEGKLAFLRGSLESLTRDNRFQPHSEAFGAFTKKGRGLGPSLATDNLTTSEKQLESQLDLAR